MTNNLTDLRHNEIPESAPLLFQLVRAAGSPLSGHICLLPPPVVSVSVYRRRECVTVRSVVGHWDKMQNSHYCSYGRERTSTLHQRSALFIDTSYYLGRITHFAIFSHFYFFILFDSDPFEYVYYRYVVCVFYIFLQMQYILNRTLQNISKTFFSFFSFFFNYQQGPNNCM